MASNGSRIEAPVTVSAIRDERCLVGGSTMDRDTGEPAALENALRFSEERYRSLSVASAQIVWTKNPQGEMVEDCPMWRAFTGQRRDEIAGKGWAGAVHPGDRDRVSGMFGNALKECTVYETEYRLRRNDGEYRYMAVRGVPVLGSDGRIREWVGTCADITERKRAEEEALQAQREVALKTRFATMFLTLPEREIFAAVLDAVLEHTHSKDGIFGYIDKDGDENGDEDGALVFPTWPWAECELPCENIRLARGEWFGVWGRALEERRSLYANEPGQSPGGSPLVNKILATPIFFQSELIGLFAVANKATDYDEGDRETLDRIAREMAPIFKARLQRDAQERARKRAEEEVRTINAGLEKRVQERTAQLEDANHELEAFAYSVSHDLRAPIRAIHGFSRILMEEYAPELSGMAQHYLEVVSDNSLQMSLLIDDLLALSRLGRQPLQKQTIQPAELVAAALHDLEPEMALRIHVEVGELPPCEGDPILLKQVFINLLSNSIKYSGRRAEARIEIGSLPVEGGRAAVYFVRDNGVGFEMRHAHKLFGVFQRLHHSAEYPGTGIGLAIVQRILHRHGGRIWAQAEVGQGATFSFTMEPEA
jgi:PAS domain S-box-containing protein